MKRGRCLQVIFMILLFLLAGRLYYVQLVCGEELTAAAHGQQMIPVLQEYQNSVVYDRNMKKITKTIPAYYYLVHREDLTPACEKLLDMTDATPAGQKGEDYIVYKTTQFKPAIHALLQRQWNAYGFCVNLRNTKNQVGVEFIQYLDETYHDLLWSEDANFYFLGNGGGGFLSGSGIVAIDSFVQGKGVPTSMVTTIDIDLQRETEDILKELNVEGCVIIADVMTGQALTVASRRAGDADDKNYIAQQFPLGMLQKKLQLELDGIMEERMSPLELCEHLLSVGNKGQHVSLQFLLRTAKAKDGSQTVWADKRLAELEKLKQRLSQNPVSAAGWTVGFIGEEGQHAVVVYTETGTARKIYQQVVKRLTAASI